MPSREHAPEPTVARLALYLRSLRAASRDGVETISSAELEKRTGITSGQIRKDLSYFGEFGRPGLGYNVTALVARLSHIMQLDRSHDVLIVGAGNLGAALSGYSGFPRAGFHVVAIYDNNYNKIGRKLWDLEILDVNRLPEMNRSMGVEVGLITTPAEAAQEVADLMVQGGVKGILNFSPQRVTVPPPAVVRHVDVTQELEVLCFFKAAQELSAAE